MIINRKKTAIYFPLFMGVGFGGLIVAAFIENEWKFNFFYLMYCFFSLNYIVQAIYNWSTPLITLEDDRISFYNFPNKKITYLTENLTLKYTVGDYIFTTETGKTYRITKSSIPENQLSSFEDFANKLMHKSTDNTNLVTS